MTLWLNKHCIRYLTMHSTGTFFVTLWKYTPRWWSNWIPCYLPTRCCFFWNKRRYNIITILCDPRNTSRTWAQKNRLFLIKVSITHNPSELQRIHAVTQKRQLRTGYRFHRQPSPPIVQHFYLRKDRSIKFFSEQKLLFLFVHYLFVYLHGVRDFCLPRLFPEIKRMPCSSLNGANPKILGCIKLKRTCHLECTNCMTMPRQFLSAPKNIYCTSCITSNTDPIIGILPL